EELSRSTEIQKYLGSSRIRPLTLDQHATLGDITQANGGRVVVIVDRARPDQGMALARPALAGSLFSLRAGVRRDLGKVTLDCLEQHGVTLGWVAADLGLVRELKADSVALYPAHHTFDGTAVVELQLGFLPEFQRQIGADHGTTARQVDQVD